MTIKEISERFGISRDTLRYYEKAGMIPRVERKPNGIREYSEEDARWIGLALCMRNAGLPVEGIAEYLRLYQQGEETALQRLNLLTRQRDILLEQRSRIDQTLERLNQKISWYESSHKRL